MPGELVLYGANFQPGLAVVIGDQPLQDVVALSSLEAHGVLPAGLAPGIYDVKAYNPGPSAASTLANSYAVLDAAGDDFFAVNEDLWSDPLTLRQSEAVMLGLNVHRQGGKSARQVTVAFYLEEEGGALQELGRVESSPMPPGQGVVEPVFLNWRVPEGIGQLTIVAIIDPDGALGEAVVSNNRVGRSVTLLPVTADVIAPVVQALQVNNGADETDNPLITLSLAATDEGGSGVTAMYLVEREFNSAARQWVAVQNTGWVPLQSQYAMTLTERGGLRYLQAWVSDGDGNISVATVKTRINYLPVSDRLLGGQVRIYRRTLEQGQAMELVLRTFAGDADLYVWRPDGGESWISNSSGTEPDSLRLTAPMAGDYQIEVYGYVTSHYQLAFAEGGALAQSGAWAVANPNKAARSQPIIQPQDEPVGSVALPTAPIENAPRARNLYLPAIVR